MHRRGDPSMGADSSQIPPQELEARKRELEAEFQRYINKAPGQAKQRLTMSSKPGVEIGLRNFLAELTNDNQKKSKTQSAYAEKYQRIVFGPSNGQVFHSKLVIIGINLHSRIQ